MSNNKFIYKLLTLGLAAGLVFSGGCKSKESAESAEEEEITTEMLLYTDALDNAGKTGEDKYKLATVKRGDFEHEVFAIGEVEYRDLYYQTLEVDQAKIVSFEVAAGDYVEKGDVILTYEPVFDEVAFAEREADVTRQEKEYQAGYDTRKAEIIKAEHELKKLTDKDEIEIKKLEIKKLKLALDNYKQVKVNIDNTKAELKAYKESIESGEIIANHTGFVLSTAEEDLPEEIGYGTVVATVSPMEDYLIKLDELPEGGIRYNSDVDITFDSVGGEMKCKGKVIMSPNILSGQNTQNYAYVKAFDDKCEYAPEGNVRVYFKSKELKDVLLVDEKAVQFETKGEGTNVNDVPYVYIYDNGTAFKRYIEVFGNNSQEYVVLSGLNEGQQVVCGQVGSGKTLGGK